MNLREMARLGLRMLVNNKIEKMLYLGEKLKGDIMRKRCESKQLGIFLALILTLSFCSVNFAQDVQEEQEKPLTPIEQKMLQKITLNFRDVPIDDILRSISEQVELNIVKSPQITATVTVSVKDVPLEEALNQILTVYGCGYVASENMIRIVPATQLAQETERTMSKIYRIVYADVKQVEQALTKVISSRGSIASSVGTSNIIITDTESNIRAIDKFLEEIDRPTPQILVEVRIYDISNTNSLDLGIEWYASRNTGYGSQPSDASDPITGYSRTNPYIVSNMSSGINKSTKTTAILDYGVITQALDIDVMLTAAQEKGAAKLLANPRIIVLDNETATFKAIREIPYQQLQQGGYQSFGTTEFKEVGVELEVTPHLAEDGMVRLHLVPVFSVQVGDVDIPLETVASTGSSIRTAPQPIVDRREADTILLVQDKQTVVIGGLRKEEVTQEMSKIPLLGDLPLVGWIFTFEGEETVNSELVVFITPKIIEENVLTDVEAMYLEGTEIPSPVPPKTRLGYTVEKNVNEPEAVDENEEMTDEAVEE